MITQAEQQKLQVKADRFITAKTAGFRVETFKIIVRYHWTITYDYHQEQSWCVWHASSPMRVRCKTLQKCFDFINDSTEAG